MPLAELQRRFAEALSDPGAVPPVASSARRFNVHRNNVAAGILGVLEARFPVVRQLVGNDFYLAMASEYVAQDPPRSPILSLYGGSFPGFVAGFEPAADVPYLADVARLEWLQHQAYHAADATPIGSAELTAIAPEDVPGVVFRLHPSLQLFASELPALSIWRAHQSVPPVSLGKLAADPEHAIILRPALEVTTLVCSAAQHAFAAALGDGRSLADATAVATSSGDDFDLQTALALLIAAGALIGFSVPGKMTG
jgi:hypothetical protein